MKYILIFLIGLLSFTNHRNLEVQNVDFVYEKIFQELKEIDTSSYYITYNLSENIYTEYYEYLEKSYKINKQELQYLTKKEKIAQSQIKISNEIATFIKNAKNNCSTKTELNYILSSPYYIGKDQIIIFNSVFYKNSPNTIKGGVKRVFIFSRTDNSWKLKEKIELIEI